MGDNNIRYTDNNKSITGIIFIINKHKLSFNDKINMDVYNIGYIL